jgi:glucose-6-phosphate isomerase
MSSPRRAQAWQELLVHARNAPPPGLRALFAADQNRFERHSREAAGLFVDYSRHALDDATWRALLQLAEAHDVAGRRDAMLRGEPVNKSEGRAALHTALRNRHAATLVVDGRDVLADIRRERARAASFAEDVRAGRWRGHTGEPMRDVVHIGIGGSDLGPRMLCQALRPYAAATPSVRFVANVDAAELDAVLARCVPATTLFIVSSKSFTTVETLANAAAARRWLSAALPGADALARHFVAVSAQPEAAMAWGMAPQNCFRFWEWVGGRCSIWSNIGLPLMIAIGPEAFDAFLAGAEAMDGHFVAAPLAENLPVLLALLGVWYRNVRGTGSHAVIPYAHALARLPAYLQQLEMESNGKSVCEDGTAAAATCPVVWGEPGTNGQHAFFQWLHQGSDVIPVDLIAVAAPSHAHAEQHDLLLANCLAQGSALMLGRSASEVRRELAAQGASASQVESQLPHRVFAGERPSTTILLPRIDPPSLGALLALYEHKVFVQSVLWNINAFDQWGVELGKALAGQVLGVLRTGSGGESLDAPTHGLITRIRQMR